MSRVPYGGDARRDRTRERRTERFDIRLTKTEKATLEAKADQTRRSLASIIAQLIDEIDKVIP